MGETDICNRALVLIGCARGISSLDEGSTEASVCRRVYRSCLESLLSEHPWSWAERVCIPSEMNFTVSGWSRLYSLPADCLSVRRLFSDAAENAPFRVLSVEEEPGHYVEAIATDLYQARMEYLSSSAAERMPVLCAEALAYRVAMEICVALKGGDINMREHLAKFYNEAVQRAAWNDANEGAELPVDWGDEYIRARN